MINERVTRLRQQSLEAKPTLSPERAQLMTQAYRQQTGLMSAPLRRALAFQYLLENKTISIGTDELIVGEKDLRPKPHPLIPNSAVTACKTSTFLMRATRFPLPSIPRRATCTVMRLFHSGRAVPCASSSLPK